VHSLEAAQTLLALAQAGHDPDSLIKAYHELTRAPHESAQWSEFLSDWANRFPDGPSPFEGM